MDNIQLIQRLMGKKPKNKRIHGQHSIGTQDLLGSKLKNKTIRAINPKCTIYYQYGGKS